MFLQEIKPPRRVVVLSIKITSDKVMSIARSGRSHHERDFFFRNAINLLCSEVDKNQMLGQENLTEVQETGPGRLARVLATWHLNC